MKNALCKEKSVPCTHIPHVAINIRSHEISMSHFKGCSWVPLFVSLVQFVLAQYIIVLLVETFCTQHVSFQCELNIYSSLLIYNGLCHDKMHIGNNQCKIKTNFTNNLTPLYLFSNHNEFTSALSVMTITSWSLADPAPGHPGHWPGLTWEGLGSLPWFRWIVVFGRLPLLWLTPC